MRLIHIDALIEAKQAMNRPHDRVSVMHLELVKAKLGAKPEVD